MKPGRIFRNRGDLDDSSLNRSPHSYLNNPEDERHRYAMTRRGGWISFFQLQPRVQLLISSGTSGTQTNRWWCWSSLIWTEMGSVWSGKSRFLCLSLSLNLPSHHTVTMSMTLSLLSWFAVHAVSMNYTNRMVSSDNMGYASCLLEQDKNPGELPGQVVQGQPLNSKKASIKVPFVLQTAENVTKTFVVMNKN